MPLDFPSSGLVANTTTYTLGTRTWLWNGSAWQLSYNPAGYTGSVGYTGSKGYDGSVGYTGSASLGTQYTAAAGWNMQ